MSTTSAIIESSKLIRLSDNFTLHELLRSAKAEELGLLNEQFNPPHGVLVNLTRLATEVLDPIRNDTWDAQPLFVTSGYREPQVNKKVGGSTSSRHQLGLAADIVALDQQNTVERRIANMQLFDACYELIDFLPIQSLIWEFGDHHGPQWIHLSAKFSGTLARRVIRAVRLASGEIDYLPYTP